MRTAILYVSFIALACTDEPLDVGETNPGSNTGGTSGAGNYGGPGENPGEPLPEWPPSTTDCVSSTDLPVTGVWEGWIQDWQFRNQLPLRVEILGASERGGLCGTLRWGEGTLPPPPTDPEHAWPDDRDLGSGLSAASYFREGATYSILDGGVRGDQVRFRITAVEFWKPWCEIQTSYWNGFFDEAWLCMPKGMSSTVTDEHSVCVFHQYDDSDVVVERAKCELCFNILTCACNEGGCTATGLNESKSAYFDLVFEEDRATGALEGNYVSVGPEVLLNRVE